MADIKFRDTAHRDFFLENMIIPIIDNVIKCIRKAMIIL